MPVESACRTGLRSSPDAITYTRRRGRALDVASRARVMHGRQRWPYEGQQIQATPCLQRQPVVKHPPGAKRPTHSPPAGWQRLPSIDHPMPTAALCDIAATDAPVVRCVAFSERAAIDQHEIVKVGFAIANHDCIPGLLASPTARNSTSHFICAIPRSPRYTVPWARDLLGVGGTACPSWCRRNGI